MTVYELKPAFQNLLQPLARTLGLAGATPNGLTVDAFLLSVGAGLLIVLWPDARWPLLVLPVALLVRMALNAMDGMMARELGMTSKLGAVLNELGDVFSDVAMYAPLAGVHGLPAPLVIAIVMLAIGVEFTGALAVQIGATRRYDGPMGKSDRAVVLGSLALAIGLGVPVNAWVDVTLVITSGLLVVTIVNRARGALAESGR